MKRLIAISALCSIVLHTSLLIAETVANDQAKDKIRGVISDHVREMNECYEAALKKDASLKGKVVIVWEVGKKGEALNVKADKDKSDLKDQEMWNCLAKKIKRLTFPAPPAGETLTISYPFFFQIVK